MQQALETEKKSRSQSMIDISQKEAQLQMRTAEVEHLTQENIALRERIAELEQKFADAETDHEIAMKKMEIALQNIDKVLPDSAETASQTQTMVDESTLVTASFSESDVTRFKSLGTEGSFLSDVSSDVDAVPRSPWKPSLAIVDSPLPEEPASPPFDVPEDPATAIPDEALAAATPEELAKSTPQSASPAPSSKPLTPPSKPASPLTKPASPLSGLVPKTGTPMSRLGMKLVPSKPGTPASRVDSFCGTASQRSSESARATPLSTKSPTQYLLDPLAPPPVPDAHKQRKRHRRRASSAPPTDHNNLVSLVPDPELKMMIAQVKTLKSTRDKLKAEMAEYHEQKSHAHDIVFKIKSRINTLRKSLRVKTEEVPAIEEVVKSSHLNTDLKETLGYLDALKEELQKGLTAVVKEANGCAEHKQAKLQHENEELAAKLKELGVKGPPKKVMEETEVQTASSIDSEGRAREVFLALSAQLKGHAISMFDIAKKFSGNPNLKWLSDRNPEERQSTHDLEVEMHQLEEEMAALKSLHVNVMEEKMEELNEALHDATEISGAIELLGPSLMVPVPKFGEDGVLSQTTLSQKQKHSHRKLLEMVGKASTFNNWKTLINTVKSAFLPRLPSAADRVRVSKLLSSVQLKATRDSEQPGQGEASSEEAPQKSEEQLKKSLQAILKDVGVSARLPQSTSAEYEAMVHVLAVAYEELQLKIPKALHMKEGTQKQMAEILEFSDSQIEDLEEHIREVIHVDEDEEAEIVDVVISGDMSADNLNNLRRLMQRIMFLTKQARDAVERRLPDRPQGQSTPRISRPRTRELDPEIQGQLDIQEQIDLKNQSLDVAELHAQIDDLDELLNRLPKDLSIKGFQAPASQLDTEGMVGHWSDLTSGGDLMMVDKAHIKHMCDSAKRARELLESTKEYIETQRYRPSTPERRRDRRFDKAMLNLALQRILAFEDVYGHPQSWDDPKYYRINDMLSKLSLKTKRTHPRALPNDHMWIKGPTAMFPPYHSSGILRSNQKTEPHLLQYMQGTEESGLQRSSVSPRSREPFLPEIRPSTADKAMLDRIPPKIDKKEVQDSTLKMRNLKIVPPGPQLSPERGYAPLDEERHSAAEGTLKLEGHGPDWKGPISSRSVNTGSYSTFNQDRVIIKPKPPRFGFSHGYRHSRIESPSSIILDNRGMTPWATNKVDEMPSEVDILSQAETPREMISEERSILKLAPVPPADAD